MSSLHRQTQKTQLYAKLNMQNCFSSFSKFFFSSFFHKTFKFCSTWNCFKFSIYWRTLALPSIQFWNSMWYIVELFCTKCDAFCYFEDEVFDILNINRLQQSVLPFIFQYCRVKQAIATGLLKFKLANTFFQLFSSFVKLLRISYNFNSVIWCLSI